MTVRSLLVMLCVGPLACSCSRKPEPACERLGQHVQQVADEADNRLRQGARAGSEDQPFLPLFGDVGAELRALCEQGKLSPAARRCFNEASRGIHLDRCAVRHGLQVRSADNAGDATAPLLQNGIYLVLAKAGVAADLSAADGTTVIEYEHPRDEDDQGPRELFLVRRVPDVPMTLAAPARVEGTPPDDISLYLSFTPEAADALERVTTEHAGKESVAVLIGGKVASVHKIRTPITGGKLQISCCGPGVCDHLRRQLAGAR